MGLRQAGTLHDDHDAIGVIAKVRGPVVDISCDRLPPLHQALCSAMDHETYIFEVYQHLDERHVRAITLHRTSGLRRGMPVFDTGAPVQVPVAPDCLGRVLNVFGEPLDNQPIPLRIGLLFCLAGPWMLPDRCGWEGGHRGQADFFKDT